MPALPEYAWLVVYAAFGAFAFGWGTGANDVANAFGTSVGSGTLKLWQAVIIAAIFEFTGALLLGRVNTEVIASGIANIKVFQRDPEVYAFGMACNLIVCAIWQGIASWLGLNVSSTHSIIGGIIGFSLVYAGPSAVKWAEQSNDAFPPYKGVVAIVIGWFLAPIIAALASGCFFLIIRTAVLRRKAAYQLSFWLLPPLVLITVFINTFFVLTKGARKTFAQDNDDWSDGKSALVAFGVGAGMAVLVAILILPVLKRRIDRRFEKDGEVKANQIPTNLKPGLEDPEKPTGHMDGQPDLPTKKSWASKAYAGATHGMTVDIHKTAVTDQLVKQLHEKAEKFSPRVEFCFSYLQVFSAICVIFAHGAGEVGYMAGPLATVWEVYQKGQLSAKVKPPVWIILIGAVGLVIGLATYGYNVTRAMGVSLAKLTPARGFCAELATAFILLLASQYGLPTSSSTTIVGAIVGVGLCEGSAGVNWKLFGKQFASWVVTMAVVGLGVAAIFSYAVFAPSVVVGRVVTGYEDRISNLTQSIYKDFNKTLTLTGPNATDFAALSLNLTEFSGKAKNLTTVAQTVSYEDMMKSLYKAMNLAGKNAAYTIGNQSAIKWVPSAYSH